MKPIAVFTTLAIALCCQSLTHAADDVKITRASLLTQPCFSCHGTNGNSVGAPLPSLAGQTEETLRTSLLAFKKGERPATLMTRIAKGYSDEDLQLIANYLATEAKPTN
ncbi:MAG: c-type cytochrome [Thiothrix sp.]|nr:MAG: c-type cytochrome [Thiothrix sp.]